MFAKTPALGIATLSILAIGCGTYEKEYEETRLVLAAEGCPSADDVTAQSYGDEASFMGARTFDRRPLCWYRIEGRATYPRPECEDSSGPTLKSIRAALLQNAIPTGELVDPPVGLGFNCTDQGLVYLDMPTTRSCEALEGRTITEMHPGIKDHLVVRELLAADAQPALTRCTYRLTGERERHFMNSK